LFGGSKELKPKRKLRMCAVCRARGPWYLVCNECEVDPVKLENRIQRTRKKFHALEFCKRCRHHGKMGFLCKKCDNRLNTYMIDRTGGWRPRIIKYDMDSEDEDYIPPKSQSNKESTHDLMAEAKELWDRV